MKIEVKKYDLAAEIIKISTERDLTPEVLRGAIEILNLELCTSNGNKEENSSLAVAPENEDKLEKCVVCNQKNALLQNEDETWICEDCAQSVSDMGNELS